MKKRTIFNALMFLLILLLGYILYTQIQEPIAFQQTKTAREKAVISQLIQIRKAQEAYRGVTGKFAPSFSALVDTLKTGKFRIVQVYGDPDDPTNTEAIRYDTTYVPAIDSVMKMGINLENIGVVPFGEGANFEIHADTTSYQSALVDVVEVGIPYGQFMGAFKDPKFKKYDERYDPKKKIKFGDRSKPILTGSWE
jgi:type II secretory pathway pseudopilin PulG